jgi:hypothetical protein
MLEFIEKLRNESFVGWHEEAVKGYLTALKTIEEKYKQTAHNKQSAIIPPNCTVCPVGYSNCRSSHNFPDCHATLWQHYALNML